jgi:hypothetical protein
MARIFLIIFISTTLKPIPACYNAGNKYFNGTIEYAYSYSSDLLNIDSLSKARPAKGIFRYDKNNYQSQFINADTITYYYSGSMNKCIAEAGSIKKYECEDYSLMTDSVLAVKEYATEEKVMGHSCRILELQKKNSWVKYYYTTDIKMAPATYEKHKAYNWDVYGKKANGGLILKGEHRFKAFSMMGIATEIKEGHQKFKALEINESLFKRICK